MELVVATQARQGMALLEAGRPQEAAAVAAALLRAHPDHPDALFLGAEIALQRGDPEQARRLLGAAIERRPGFPPLLLKQARTLLAMRRRLQARAAALAAAAAAGRDPRTLWSAGALLARCNDPVSAAEMMSRACETGLDDPRLLHDLAWMQYYTGATGDAEAVLAQLLARQPDAGAALYLRSVLHLQTPEHNHVDDIERRLRTGLVEPEARAAALYALAKECEDLGQDRRGWQALAEGAALKRSGLDYRLQPELDAMRDIAAAWDATVLDDLVPGAGTVAGEGEAIFVVGMPRTGTTLVERILCRHPAVGAAGELADFGELLGAAARAAAAGGEDLATAARRVDAAALGAEYLAGAREAAHGARIPVDKMPVNFLYCGMIRRALPRARIVHLVREPMDACYAVHKTLFHRAYHFSCDLAELAGYYAGYRGLMRHWHAAMPGAILDVRYEDLVADPQGQARRLLDWCGLDWDGRVLDAARDRRPVMTASAAQATRPIYATSIGKWRRHAEALTPLQARLRGLGLDRLD